MAFALIAAGLGVGALRMPGALSKADWESRADRSRAEHAAAMTDLDAAQEDTTTIRADLAEQEASRHEAERTIGKQKKTIASLEERIRELGGDPSGV